jgi:putative phage-type endonuclease
MEQRSDDWFKARLGKVTASRTANFMGIKGVGQMGETYALELAHEYLFGHDASGDFQSYDMQRGVELEPLAFNCFKDLMSMDFVEVSKADFIEIDANSGGSPDGIVGENEPLEIKCPKSDTFFKVVLTDEIDQKYYDQMQFQMIATGGNQAHYFVYYIHNGKEMYHHIKVARDENRIELMKDRINQIVEKRDQFIEILKSKKQWQ